MNFDFKGLPQLIKRFPDDATARHYFESLRWNGCPVCPFCKADKYYKLNDGKTYKCGNKECHKKYTVTTGTIFHSSHIPLNTWFAAIYLISSHKKGISSHQIARDLCVTQKTAWFMLHRVREMVKDKAPQKLTSTVEVDETWAGGKMRNKHKDVRLKAHVGNESHTSNKTAIMGFLQRGAELKLTVVDKTDGTFKDLVRKNVDNTALIITDSLTAYKGLDKEFAGHEIVNHNENEYVRGDIYTNSIEGAFGLFKRGIYGIYHQVSVKHLQRYCDEFTHRYNSRKIKDNDRFSITLSKPEGRLKYSQLIAK